jgi:serine/threonine-protein kinase
LLESENFAAAQRHRRFLEFVVEQTLDGHEATIKESVIGSEVFGREAGYDPRADAIVRVEATKLRARLASYYEGSGRNDAIVIDVPKGSYVPRFTAREESSDVTTRHRRPLRLVGAIVIVAAIGVAVAWNAKERASGSSAIVEMPSVAVLPFLNLSADPDNQYFGDGLAEQLTDTLAHVRGLRVASRTSAFAFRGRAADAQEIGKKLGVSALIEGSVRKEEGRVRITAQLVQTSDGYHLWSQTFEREVHDVFAIQDEISLAIARQLRVSLSASERTRLSRPPTQNLEAFDLYLRGRFILGGFPSPALAGQASALFEEALKKDPQFALAHNAIARVKSTRWINDEPGSEELITPILAAARRAIELDPDLAEAYSTLATLQGRHDWNWTEAEKTFRRAITLNPNSPDVHHSYAHNLLLPLHRFDEAIAENRKAIELDPYTLVFATGLAWILDHAGRADEALAQYRQVSAAWPGNPAVSSAEGLALLHAGRYQEATAVFEVIASQDERATPDVRPLLALAYAGAGRNAAAADVRKRLVPQARSRGTAMRVALALGRLDDARSIAMAMVRDHSANVYYLTLDPMLRPLLDDPALAALLRQTGLPVDGTR